MKGCRDDDVVVEEFIVVWAREVDLKHIQGLRSLREQGGIVGCESWGCDEDIY